MDSLWPWLTVAGLGALHGLSPTTGWMFAAAWGVQQRSAACAGQALLSIAIGHAASVAAVAWLVTQGAALDLRLFGLMAGGLLIGTALYCLGRGPGTHCAISPEASHAGMALWSFFMASAHGAGLMLIPALAPMCLSDGAARMVSESMLIAMAAVALHMTAMLLTTGLIAGGVVRTQEIFLSRRKFSEPITTPAAETSMNKR